LWEGLLVYVEWMEFAAISDVYRLFGVTNISTPGELGGSMGARRPYLWRIISIQRLVCGLNNSISALGLRAFISTRNFGSNTT